MSNVLKVSHQETIRSLHEKGWSDRRIARELGINRRTVNRYWAKCTITPPGSADEEESKCTIVPTGKSMGRKSQCDPFTQAINETVEAGLSGQRIYQDLVEESGFTGSYDAVKRFVGKLRKARQIGCGGWKASPERKCRWTSVWERRLRMDQVARAAGVGYFGRC